MKRTLKRFLCVLLVAMMALSLASCGKKEEESGELKKLSISHHPVLSGLPAYVALQKGFFEEEGLDVDIGETRLVDITVRRLREKIEDVPSCPKTIVTRRGLGYAFTGQT